MIQSPSKQSISIVIPCYNEEEGIPNLIQKLTPAVEALQKKHSVELIFVDDGSTDKTNELLHRSYNNNPKAKIIKHETNRNLGAALRTGFQHASGDLVAALDCDCTYDPILLLQMVEMLDEQTDIVTVSPYHPQGRVSKIPPYRLILSKGASFLYRVLLSWDLYTYTAMVRIYKKEVIRAIPFERDDFLGVTELLVKALLKRYAIKELPAELQMRKFGSSKMKKIPLKVIKDHFSLMSSIIKHKITGHY